MARRLKQTTHGLKTETNSWPKPEDRTDKSWPDCTNQPMVTQEQVRDACEEPRQKQKQTLNLVGVGRELVGWLMADGPVLLGWWFGQMTMA